MFQINMPVKILKNFKVTIFHFCFGFLCGWTKLLKNESMLNAVFYFTLKYVINLQKCWICRCRLLFSWIKEIRRIISKVRIFLITFFLFDTWLFFNYEEKISIKIYEYWVDSLGSSYLDKLIWAVFPESNIYSHQHLDSTFKPNWVSVIGVPYSHVVVRKAELAKKQHYTFQIFLKGFCSESTQNEQIRKKSRISCELEASQILQLLREMSSELWYWQKCKICQAACTWLLDAQCWVPSHNYLMYF